jgi:hypothetical protein
MRRTLVLLLACLAIVAGVAAAAAPAQQGDDCTWGASSVVVEQVNGQFVQSEPGTSGCIPG